MNARRILAVVGLAAGGLALWATGGCASVLGVDSADYADASALLCLCADDSKSCAAEVEEAVGKDEELEKITLECLAEVDKPECGASTVASCVFEKGYCVEEPGKRCLVGRDGETVIGCCDGLACEATKCCVPSGGACTATGKECCGGLTCNDEVCGVACTAQLTEGCTRDADCCQGSCTKVGVGPKTCELL